MPSSSSSAAARLQRCTSEPDAIEDEVGQLVAALVALAQHVGAALDRVFGDAPSGATRAGPGG